MKRSTPWLIALLLVAAGIAGGYYFRQMQAPRQTVAPVPPPADKPAPQAEEETPVKPLVRYPVPEPQEEKAPAESAASGNRPAAAEPASGKPLPPLSDSDPVLKDELDTLISGKVPGGLFHLDHIVRRIVVTVDNLPRSQVPPKYRFMQAVPGKFAASGEDDEQTLSADNYARYRPYVDWFESLNARAVVAAYIRLYPLFQQSYRNLGYPKAYFNDRVVQAIDDMLDAPQPDGPIKLKRPSVMYKFVDPGLEALSAGQKIMIRIGPDNSRRVKAKLRELRSELLDQAKKGRG